jgi:hypothetical protein
LRSPSPSRPGRPAPTRSRRYGGFHLDLVRLQLDDLETYLPCWGPLDLPGPQAQRRHVYTGLIFSYGSMGYGVGEISEPWLRNMLAGMFRNEFARRYWRSARDAWVASAGGNRRGLRFVAIVDDEYDRAVAAGPPVESDEPPGAVSHPPPTTPDNAAPPADSPVAGEPD